jgi:hypothetical protein
MHGGGATCVSLSLVGIDQLVERYSGRDNHFRLKQWRAPAESRVPLTVTLTLSTYDIRQSLESPPHWHCCILDTRKALISPHIRQQYQREAMAASWESYKDTLRTLYIDRGETLKDIMSCMSELHGFKMRCGDD